MRMPFQVLIFPFIAGRMPDISLRAINEKNGYLYAIFKRKDLKFWQGISGGGEDKETPTEAAKREVFEETKIDKTSGYIALDSMTTIPITNVGNYKWKEGILVLPEYSFGVEVFSKDLKVGKEHSSYKWFPYEKAKQLLKYDSNKTALWELNHRLKKMVPSKR